MKTIEENRVPIKIWTEDIEESAVAQIKNLANLPFAFHHVAIMPDVHAGLGMPIGGVLATEGIVVPNAVGVDIGCGMCAVKSSIHKSELTEFNIELLIRSIKYVIPLGFDWHPSAQDESLMPQNHDINAMKVVKNNFKAALKQLGTLGGGNHFIEIQEDEDGYIWIMIHSGSRNLGLKVCEHYAKKARYWLEKWHVPYFRELEYFPIEIEDARMYMKEMQYCIEFALANRKLMMERCKETIISIFPNATFDEMINIAHNYAAWEKHFDKKVLVHRKGATRANKGEIGIIPGSQGTNSYIVEGLGNEESFMSCSHGAGRKLSRRQAIKNLNLEQEIENLDKLGIYHSITKQKDLDEAPSAYKDIEEIIASELDLIRVC